MFSISGEKLIRFLEAHDYTSSNGFYYVSLLDVRVGGVEVDIDESNPRSCINPNLEYEIWMGNISLNADGGFSALEEDLDDGHFINRWLETTEKE